MDLKKPISCALSALVLTSAVTPLSLAVEYEQSVKAPTAVHGSAPETVQSQTAVLYSSQNVLTLAEYDAKLAQFTGTAADKAANPAYETLLLQRRLVEKAGYDALTTKMEKDTDFAACMEWLVGAAPNLRGRSTVCSAMPRCCGTMSTAASRRQTGGTTPIKRPQRRTIWTASRC